jgi:hypothetical protein
LTTRKTKIFPTVHSRTEQQEVQASLESYVLCNPDAIHIKSFELTTIKVL